LIQRVREELRASDYCKFLNMLESWRSYKSPHSTLLELYNLENLEKIDFEGNNSWGRIEISSESFEVVVWKGISVNSKPSIVSQGVNNTSVFWYSG